MPTTYQAPCWAVDVQWVQHNPPRPLVREGWGGRRAPNAAPPVAPGCPGPQPLPRPDSPWNPLTPNPPFSPPCCPEEGSDAETPVLCLKPLGPGIRTRSCPSWLPPTLCKQEPPGHFKPLFAKSLSKDYPLSSNSPSSAPRAFRGAPIHLAEAGYPRGLAAPSCFPHCRPVLSPRSCCG